MQKYNVTGMSCAACSTRVEKAVQKVEGVKSCAVSLLTNSMSVEGEAPPEIIIKAVKDAGYGASLKNAESIKTHETPEKDGETSTVIKRLIASVILTLTLMYFSMGHMVGLELPQFFANNHIAVGITELLLSASVMVINQKFFVNGFKSLLKRSPNMDTLVALGSFSSFAFSVYSLIMLSNALLSGDLTDAERHMNNFYFESAAMIVTLITVGKLLESRSKGKTADALKSLIKLRPKEATVVRNGAEIAVPISELKKGDIFAVRAGESIPADGIVTEGSGTVNESALTGESIPADKTVGDRVSAATISQSGYLLCEALKVGEDTALSEIIRMVEDAAATKAPIAKLADKVSGVFVPVVMLISLVTAIIWAVLGYDFGTALTRAVSVLVISCPCALGLATPVAITVGGGAGARNGILFKNAVSLEEAGKIKTCVFDKTGTITSGEPSVTDIIPIGVSKAELTQKAVSLEQKSEHPLAKAVVKLKSDNISEYPEATEYKTHTGSGVSAVIRGKTVCGGSLKFIENITDIPAEIKKRAEELSGQGKTPLIFTEDSAVLGIIAVADKIRESSAQAVSELKRMGIRTVMLTGDNEITANAVGKQAGVDEVIAGVLPDGKARVVSELKKNGKTAMVGDGINDSVALTSADIGIAVGTGTDVAVDAADIVLMKSNLIDVAAAIRLSRATLKNIRENLFWAFIYNIIGIPLAAGALSWAGINLSPMLGAAAMSLSSFCVVTNALRLNFLNLYPEDKFKKGRNKTMTKTIKIEGMMCPHCEKRVKTALEALTEVSEAEVSHMKSRAVVTLTSEISNEALKNCVESQGYKVLSVE